MLRRAHNRGWERDEVDIPSVRTLQRRIEAWLWDYNAIEPLIEAAMPTFPMDQYLTAMRRAFNRSLHSGYRTLQESLVQKAWQPIGNVGAAEWVSANALSAANNEGIRQRKRIIRVLADGVRDGANPYEIATHLVRSIGLTSLQAQWLANRETKWRAQGMSQRKINGRLKKFKLELRTNRAEVIARTEVLRANNAATVLSSRAMQAAGMIGESLKEWVTIVVGPCPVCEPLDGARVRLDDMFLTSSGPSDFPPLHPNCRCNVVVIPADAPTVPVPMRKAAPWYTFDKSGAKPGGGGKLQSYGAGGRYAAGASVPTSGLSNDGSDWRDDTQLLTNGVEGDLKGDLVSMRLKHEVASNITAGLRARIDAGDSVLADEVANAVSDYENMTGNYHRIRDMRSAVSQDVRTSAENYDDPIDEMMYIAAAGAVQTWAHTSSNGEGRSVALQEIVRREFGIENASTGYMSTIAGSVAERMETPARYDSNDRRIADKFQPSVDTVTNGLMNDDPEMLSVALAIGGRGAGAYAYAIDTSGSGLGNLNRAIIREQYDQTQQFLEDSGVTSVNVYRGMRFNQWGENPPPAEFNQVTTNSPVSINANPVSSWSSNNHTANDFANGGDPNGYQVVLSAVVPRERIFSTPRTGAGCFRESEFVVLGGPGTATINMVRPNGWADA